MLISVRMEKDSKPEDVLNFLVAIFGVWQHVSHVHGTCHCRDILTPFPMFKAELMMNT